MGDISTCIYKHQTLTHQYKIYAIVVNLSEIWRTTKRLKGKPEL